MSNLPTIQNVAWETGLQAVKASANFDSFDAFAKHLRETIPQNSVATRVKYAGLIARRLFPDHRLDGINTRTWKVYKDEAVLNDLVRVTTLEAEPVIAKFVVEQVLSVAPGASIEPSTVRDFISSIYGAFKKDSYNRLLAAAARMGFVSRENEKWIVRAIPRPSNAFLILLHARLAPTPRIVRLTDILTPLTPSNGGADRVPFWRLLGMREEGDVRAILRDAEAAGLISKYAVVDQLEQITTRYSLDEYLAAAYRL